MDAVMAGVILGVAAGAIGGIVGTAASIRNTNSPRERAFVIRCAAVMWIAVILLLVGMEWLPRPMGTLLLVGMFLVLFPAITRLNAVQQRIRREDAMSECEASKAAARAVCSICGGNGINYHYSLPHIIIAIVAMALTACLAQREWEAHRFGGAFSFWLRYGMPLAWVAVGAPLAVWLSYRVRRGVPCGLCASVAADDSTVPRGVRKTWPRIGYTALGLGVVHGAFFESYLQPAHDAYDPARNTAQRFVECLVSGNDFLSRLRQPKNGNEGPRERNDPPECGSCRSFIHASARATLEAVENGRLNSIVNQYGLDAALDAIIREWMTDWARFDAHSPRIENIEFSDLKAVAFVQAVRKESGKAVRGKLRLSRESRTSPHWAVSRRIELEDGNAGDASESGSEP